MRHKSLESRKIHLLTGGDGGGMKWNKKTLKNKTSNQN